MLMKRRAPCQKISENRLMKISDDEADKIKVQRMDSEDFNIHGNFTVMGSKPRTAVRKSMGKYFDNAMGNYGNISTHKRRCMEKSTGNIC